MVAGWCLVTQFTINVCHGLRLRIKFVMKESAGDTSTETTRVVALPVDVGATRSTLNRSNISRFALSLSAVSTLHTTVTLEI